MIDVSKGVLGFYIKMRLFSIKGKYREGGVHKLTKLESLKKFQVNKSVKGCLNLGKTEMVSLH